MMRRFYVCAFLAAIASLFFTGDAVGDRDIYTGFVRVYVTEEISRWLQGNGVPYHSAFLDVALEEGFTLTEDDSVEMYVEWDGSECYYFLDQTFDDIDPDNVRIMAAVCDSTSYIGYNFPPSSGPFDVHEVDACAAAPCGNTGYNTCYGEFTHFAFVIDGSATW